MHFIAILLGAWALCEVLAAPTHLDVEMTLRIEDRILSHRPLPLKNSMTTYRLDDFSSFYIADVIGDPKHIAIIDTELSTDGCAKKIDLPSDDYCRKTFSFAGVDDLHLEECDRDYPLLFRGDAQYGGCGSPPPIILSCPDFLIAPRFRCFLPSTGEARWAKGISNVETAFRVEDHILSHQALPSKNSITASSFFIADFKDPEHVAIIDTDLSTNVCAKIDLLPKDFYSKTFSFAGVDGLSLEGPGLTYPLVLRGTAGYRECSAPPSFTINCPGNDYRPRFTCPLK